MSFQMEQMLTKALTKYQNPVKTKNDVTSAVKLYPGLTLAQDIYTFNDGTPMELVKLSGTIPVPYKGNFYNIPVCIWLMDTHPKNAPICYVTPTSDMHIKVSMFVDQNGKIYLPYLHDWVPNQSDLLGLIQVMICTFGEQPPVYSKPRDAPYPTQSQYSMPQPSGTGFYSYQPQVASYGAQGYPPYPPYSSPSGGSNFPPYPTSSYPSMPAMFPPASPGTFNTGGGTDARTGTIKDEHIRESLLTGIEEKLKRRLKEKLQQNQAELETLRRTQDELKQGKLRLEEILGRMQKERNDLDKNITVLKDKEQELDLAIARLENEDPIDVDDAVTTTAPLYKQLLNAFAEEAALEDAIYYMGEALRCGVIDLDVFLRQVRTLSRKQFMLRALMQKCRQKAGLAG